MVQAQYESLGWLTATTVRGAAFPAVTTTVLLTTFVLQRIYSIPKFHLSQTAPSRTYTTPPRSIRSCAPSSSVREHALPEQVVLNDSGLLQWASNVFIPWTIGLENPTFDGSCSTEAEDGSVEYTRPIWDWRYLNRVVRHGTTVVVLSAPHAPARPSLRAWVQSCGCRLWFCVQLLVINSCVDAEFR